MAKIYLIQQSQTALYTGDIEHLSNLVSQLSVSLVQHLHHSFSNILSHSLHRIPKVVNGVLPHLVVEYFSE